MIAMAPSVNVRFISQWAQASQAKAHFRLCWPTSASDRGLAAACRVSGEQFASYMGVPGIEAEHITLVVLTVNSIPLAQSRESGDACVYGRRAQTDLVDSHRAIPITNFARG
jgi:hypothetical protein